MNGANDRNTARRRRADTIARCERIMETARRLPLTRDVLAEAIERATPAQLDLMEGWLDAEIESRERSKRVRLQGRGIPEREGHRGMRLVEPAHARRLGARAARDARLRRPLRGPRALRARRHRQDASRGRVGQARVACARYRSGSSP